MNLTPEFKAAMEDYKLYSETLARIARNTSMPALSKLTIVEWAILRSLWERDPRKWFRWLVRETKTSLTPQSIGIHARREGWAKIGENMKSKLTDKQWLECRIRWEDEPRDGYAWLVAELGLPVSDEAIRKRALKDGWRKKGGLSSIVQQAQLRADIRTANRLVGAKVGEVGGEVGGSEAVDLRSKIIETHRDEWAKHRGYFPLKDIAGIDEGNGERGEPNLDLAKAAKAAAEVLKLRQDGERRAWGLDAVVQSEDHAVSTEELDRIYEEGMARMQYEELNGEAAD
ncbi:hypothetical protein CCP3SC15_530004 [Gammaproteobacteria bacterium]